MEVVIVEGARAAGALVADAVARVVHDRPSAVLGLATGSSPLPIYRELIARHQRGELSFADTTMFLLDEYVGLPAGHRESYRQFIAREFTDAVDVADSAVHGPDGTATDLVDACARYEALIAASGGIDLQILGIGADGHIGFNEPVSSLGSRTRLKTLVAQTRADNARFFDGDEAVPRHVVTQGIATILEARHLVLIATGESKAAPIAAAVEGPVAAAVPASALQLHPHVTVVVDKPAASQLVHSEYYRETFLNKPSWQHI